MCGVCGLLGGGPHWSAAVGVMDPEAALTLRAERARSVALLNRLTLPRGVRISTWSGTSLLVAGPTGAQEIVESLSEVWPAVDRLGRGLLDPLSPDTLPSLPASGASHA